MAAIIFLLLPAFVLAGIEIKLSGKYNGGNSSNISIHFSGQEVGVISDVERTTFRLDDNTLKDAVRAYFGERPTDAYLRSPTPWGDLYQTYGWPQVRRTLVPISGRILEINTEPQIVVQQMFQNNSTNNSANFNVAISQTVANKLSSRWFKGGALTVGQEIRYAVGIEMMNFGGATTLSYTSSWGEDTEKSQTVTFGATCGMALTLQPLKSVIAELQATRGTIRMEVEYEDTLFGYAAVNYFYGYKGHHFWGLDVESVMAAIGISNRFLSKQIVDIGFYANANVVVRDN